MRAQTKQTGLCSSAHSDLVMRSLLRQLEIGGHACKYTLDQRISSDWKQIDLPQKDAPRSNPPRAISLVNSFCVLSISSSCSLWYVRNQYQSLRMHDYFFLIF